MWDPGDLNAADWTAIGTWLTAGLAGCAALVAGRALWLSSEVFKADRERVRELEDRERQRESDRRLEQASKVYVDGVRVMPFREGTLRHVGTKATAMAVLHNTGDLPIYNVIAGFEDPSDPATVLIASQSQFTLGPKSNLTLTADYPGSGLNLRTNPPSPMQIDVKVHFRDNKGIVWHLNNFGHLEYSINAPFDRDRLDAIMRNSKLDLQAIIDSQRDDATLPRPYPDDTSR